MVFVYLCFREARSSLLGTDASDRIYQGANDVLTTGGLWWEWWTKPIPKQYQFLPFSCFFKAPQNLGFGDPPFLEPPNSRGILLGLDGAKRPKPFQRLWRTHVEIHAPLPDFCGRYRSVLLWESVETLRGLIQIDLSHLISGIRKPEKVPTHPRILHLMSIDLLKCCDVWSIGTSRVGEVQEFAIVSLLVGSSLAQDQVKATPLQLLSQWFDSTIGHSCDQQLPICTVDSTSWVSIGQSFRQRFFKRGLALCPAPVSAQNLPSPWADWFHTRGASFTVRIGPQSHDFRICRGTQEKPGISLSKCWSQPISPTNQQQLKRTDRRVEPVHVTSSQAPGQTLCNVETAPGGIRGQRCTIHWDKLGMLQTGRACPCCSGPKMRFP